MQLFPGTSKNSNCCTWYQVLGTKYLVPSTWYQVPGSKYLVPSTWYQVLGTKYLVPGTWYQVLGTKYLVSSTKYGTCTWYQNFSKSWSGVPDTPDLTREPNRHSHIYIYKLKNISRRTKKHLETSVPRNMLENTYQNVPRKSWKTRTKTYQDVPIQKLENIQKQNPCC